MKTYLYIVIALLVSGCANLEYVKTLKPEELLYQPIGESSSDDFGGVEKGSQSYMSIGASVPGYIGIDRSEERVKFDLEYPIVPHEKDSLTAISESNFHRMRLGQAIVFAADIDKRTSGFLKDKMGMPISISGRFRIDEQAAISSGIASGVAVGATSAVISINSINTQLAPSGLKLSNVGENSVAGGQMAQGLIVGLIAGGIHTIMANKALEGMVAAKSFGEIMQATTTTAAHMLPNANALGPDGLVSSAVPVVVGPGIVKRYFLKALQKTVDYKQEYSLITIVGTYRGQKYEKEYPNTLGWEYFISNMSLLSLHPGESEIPEKSFRGLSREIKRERLM